MIHETIKVYFGENFGSLKILCAVRILQMTITEMANISEGLFLKYHFSVRKVPDMEILKK